MHRGRKYTEEQLIEAVQTSRSGRQAALKLGLADAGSNYDTIYRNAVRLDLNISHWTRQGWSRGLTSRNKQPIEYHLVKGGSVRKQWLKERLIKENLIRYACAICNNSGSWRGKKLVLRLDHIDGDRFNNELQNLRLLCPNCDSQTDFYCKGKPTYSNLVEKARLERV